MLLNEMAPRLYKYILSWVFDFQSVQTNLGKTCDWLSNNEGLLKHRPPF